MGCIIAHVCVIAGMIKVVGIVVLSAVFLGESKIFTVRWAHAANQGPH